MRESGRSNQAMPDHTLTKTTFGKATYIRVMMTKQDHVTRLVSTYSDKMLQSATEDRVILEDNRTGQTLIDNLSVGVDMTQSTGQFTIGQMP